jgi:hypothetical protein
LQTLPKIAQGDANKMWIVPSEFSKALEGLASLGGAGGEGAKSWLDVEPSGNGGQRTADGIDTSDWFQSQLPPAAEQPEAKIELSSIADMTPSVPPMPTAPSLSEVTEEAREGSTAAYPGRELPPGQ